MISSSARNLSFTQPAELMSAYHIMMRILALYHITLSDPSSEMFTRMSARTSELGGTLLMSTKRRVVCMHFVTHL